MGYFLVKPTNQFLTNKETLQEYKEKKANKLNDRQDIKNFYQQGFKIPNQESLGYSQDFLNTFLIN